MFNSKQVINNKINPRAFGFRVSLDWRIILTDIFSKLKLIKHKPQKTGPINYIIAGLGNPGSKYENTRHNVGFRAIDYIAKCINIEVKGIKFKSLYGVGDINNKNVLLIKPQTFMNNSGQAITEAMSFYKIPPQNTIIIFDDISLDVGKMRIRRKGSDGGHNGMKNIIYLSGKDTFPRVKVGVGKKPNPNWDLADWVLSNFNKEDNDTIEKELEKIYQAVNLLVDDKIDEAMNKFNG